MKHTPDEIDALIISFIDGDISEKEHSVLQELIASDPSINSRFNELVHRFNNVASRQEREEALAHITANSIINRHKKARRVQIAAWTAAASLIIVLGIFLVLSKQAPEKVLATKDVKANGVTLDLGDGQTIDLDQEKSTIAHNGMAFHNSNQTLAYASGNGSTAKATISVAPGRFYHLQLSDGTKLIINSDSKVRFPISFSGPSREIWMEGEAYLDVASNSASPFIVHLAKSKIEVLGTRFNVSTYDTVEKVSLASGKVKVRTGLDSVYLSPGFQSFVPSEDGKISVERFDEETEFSWTQGIFHYDTDLGTIAAAVYRWYGIKMIVSDRVKKQRFYGIIDRNEPIDNFLNRLKLTAKIEYQKMQDSVIIK
ncbi:FecR domain-containing protein [Chitinophaga rhizophila]|uniref:FecR domain-containing protein n=1 Tax=Chitinophaga rhizophila TaxID=2866212 RepID=A0ABS7G765_9BACT|nr:FecR domain-containing protein [Chitinophaga rhizophila]MBW8683485.1 FecR domain-containing protein [Chitinophaga rhizophila]